MSLIQCKRNLIERRTIESNENPSNVALTLPNSRIEKMERILLEVLAMVVVGQSRQFVVW